jgi:hypothetical protein
MKAYHAEAAVNNEGQVLLSLPFPHGQKLKILARPLPGSEEDDKAWALELESFLKEDSNQDAAYDNYDEWRKNRDASENIK